MDKHLLWFDDDGDDDGDAEHRTIGCCDNDDDDNDAVAAVVDSAAAAAFLNPAVPAGKKPEPTNPCVPVTRTMQAIAVHEG